MEVNKKHLKEAFLIGFFVMCIPVYPINGFGTIIMIVSALWYLVKKIME